MSSTDRKRYIPSALLLKEVTETQEVRYGLGGSPDINRSVGMKAGPFLTEMEALEEIGSDGDFIYKLGGAYSERTWEWVAGGWNSFNEDPLDSVPSSNFELVDELPDDSTPSTVVVNLGDTKEVVKKIEHERVLSEDQIEAWSKLKVWATNRQPYFVLKGFAGTGKTFLLQLLKELSVDVYYSAPTNKAAKVLGRAVGKPTKTTYSILGLRMEQVDDKLVLTPSGNVPYFPAHSILVVDEGSMVGGQLCSSIEEARIRCNIKILYVGDPAQLPPVGEKRSPAWKSTDNHECRAMLRKVMRFDNQLLTLATALRTCIRDKDWNSPLASDHAVDENGLDTGIWKWRTEEQFERNLLLRVGREDMSDTKVIAWRNKTVNRYNALIREKMGFEEAFCVGDSLMLAEPIDMQGVLIGHTDDEVKVVDLDKSIVKVDNLEIPVWKLQVTGEVNTLLDVAEDQSDVDVLLAKKAAIAHRSTGMSRKAAWKDFWETKALFNRVRYGYAMTAHRSQGSTCKNVYLNQMDILSNANKYEAFRCLYVGATRPTTNLYSF